MSVIAAVGLNPTSSLAVTIRRNRGYAVRSIDAMAPGPSVPPTPCPSERYQRPARRRPRASSAPTSWSSATASSKRVGARSRMPHGPEQSHRPGPCA